MKDYSAYVKIFDKLNRNIDGLQEFASILNPLVKTGNNITDVGAGTAFFTEVIVNKKDCQLNIVEPSEDMLKVCIDRMRKSSFKGNINYIQKNFDEAYQYIDQPQDMFIFMRSFYCLYEDINEYKKIPEMLYKKLNNGGKVCISNIPTKVYDESKEVPFLDDVENKIFTETKKVYNEMVEKNLFHPMNNLETDKLFLDNGFSLFYRKELTNVYIKN